MARIPREIVDTIRDRTDIVEVVSRHVQLQRRGASWVGLCPFHQEKTPSFNVVPGKGMYHCFGCQKSGDVFRFLQELEGLSFVEAVKELAGPAGVTIEERQLSRAELDALRARATLYDVLEEAAKFFEAYLWTSPEGRVARDYLERRAMSGDLAREARLGWAPGGWTRLVDHLHRKGFRAALVEEAGLARTRDGGDGHYDAFRERVIIPIRDERQRVIAFGGRLIEGDGPKYINSPETRLYQKSHVLYGLDAARRAIGQRERVILVEGYFDVLSMHQAGFRETVATCGTSLTPEHVAKLRRLTRNVIVLLDADEAGARAAERTLPLFEQSGIQAWRLQLPDAKDPDDLLREHGIAAMEQALQMSAPLLPWVAERKVRSYGYNAQGKARAREELAEMLGGLSAAQAADLAPVLRLEERDMIEWARAWRPRAAAAPPEPGGPLEPEVPGRPPWQPHRDVIHLLWLVVHRRDQVADLLAEFDPRMLLAGHDAVVPSLARLYQNEAVASVIAEETDAGVRRALSAIVAQTELYTPEQARSALMDVLVRLLRPRLQGHSETLKSRMDEQKRSGDYAAFLSTLSEYDALDRTRRALDEALAAGDVDTCLVLLKRVVTLVDEA